MHRISSTINKRYFSVNFATVVQVMFQLSTEYLKLNKLLLVKLRKLYNITHFVFMLFAGVQVSYLAVLSTQLSLFSLSILLYTAVLQVLYDLRAHAFTQMLTQRRACSHCVVYAYTASCMSHCVVLTYTASCMVTLNLSCLHCFVHTYIFSCMLILHHAC